jgi:hypothetical protein
VSEKGEESCDTCAELNFSSRLAAASLVLLCSTVPQSAKNLIVLDTVSSTQPYNDIYSIVGTRAPARLPFLSQKAEKWLEGLGSP